jgi:hypothetical protein
MFVGEQGQSSRKTSLLLAVTAAAIKISGTASF